MNRLQSILANKHTSVSAAISFICIVGGIWLPKYKDQFHQTLEAALTYGMLMAGDAPKTPPKQNEKDTPHISGSGNGPA